MVSKDIPYYVRYYLQELGKHFSEVVLLTNKETFSASDLQFLSENKITYHVYQNEGMDFGMWYKAFRDYDLTSYDRVGLINDSCILFKSLKHVFEKAAQSDADAYGMVMSGKFSLHLQSYFILLSGKAIESSKDFFLSNKIIEGYKRIIFQYELGLSRRLLEKNLKLDAFFDYSENTSRNPSYLLSKELISKGAPLIKKKLLNRRFMWGDYLTWMRNDIDIEHRKYVECILTSNRSEDLIDLPTVIDELGSERNRIDIALYRLVYFFYRRFRKISFLRALFHGMLRIKRRLYE
jgi:lipopolysaccharide biosynthesis protein